MSLDISWESGDNSRLVKGELETTNKEILNCQATCAVQARADVSLGNLLWPQDWFLSSEIGVKFHSSKTIPEILSLFVFLQKLE